MNASILQFDYTNIFKVKKYLKKFNKWKSINKDLLKYLKVGVVFGIVDDIKNECTGVIILINQDDNESAKYCYIACYQIDSINVGKITSQTLYSFVLKYSGSRDFIINIPGDRNIVEKNKRLVFGYANNYYIKKDSLLCDPFFRGIYSSIVEFGIYHDDTVLSRFYSNYSKNNSYHIHPSKSIIEDVRSNSDICIETEYNLIYLKSSGSFNEIIAFWSLAHKNNSSSLNRKIFSDVKRELLKYDKPYIYDASVIRGAVTEYNDGLLKISNIIRNRNISKGI